MRFRLFMYKIFGFILIWDSIKMMMIPPKIISYYVAVTVAL